MIISANQKDSLSFFLYACFRLLSHFLVPACSFLMVYRLSGIKCAVLDASLACFLKLK